MRNEYCISRQCHTVTGTWVGILPGIVVCPVSGVARPHRRIPTRLDLTVSHRTRGQHYKPQISVFLERGLLQHPNVLRARIYPRTSKRPEHPNRRMLPRFQTNTRCIRSRKFTNAIYVAPVCRCRRAEPQPPKWLRRSSSPNPTGLYAGQERGRRRAAVPCRPPQGRRPWGSP